MAPSRTPTRWYHRTGSAPTPTVIELGICITGPPSVRCTGIPISTAPCPASSSSAFNAPSPWPSHSKCTGCPRDTSGGRNHYRDIQPVSRLNSHLLNGALFGNLLVLLLYLRTSF